MSLESVLSEMTFDTSFTVKKQETSDSLSKNAKQFLKKAQVKTHRLKQKTLQTISNVDRDLRLPSPSEQLRIRTQTQFNMIAIVLKAARVHGFIDELTVATYTLNKEAFSVIKDLVKSGVVKKLNLVLASSYSFRDKEQYEAMKRDMILLSQNFDVSLVFAWLHFKITLIQCGASYYQIEGSMNYSMNNMAEQLLIENDLSVYNFDYDFIMKTMRDTDSSALEVIC